MPTSAGLVAVERYRDAPLSGKSPLFANWMTAVKEQIVKPIEDDGMNPLKQLEACGQSVWLDYLKRSLIESGELRTLIEHDGLKGVTSNPSIFEKAIGETDEYADALKQFQAQSDHGLRADPRSGRLQQSRMLSLPGQR